MDLDVALAIAVPAIALTMIAEALLGRSQGRDVYRWPSLISDLSCGVASLVGKGLVGISAVACYDFVQVRFGLIEMSTSSAWAWILGFLLMDLTLYGRHRACHRVGLFWALHAVHHQSPDLNMGTANRVPWLQDLQVLPFVFIPALFGFPTVVFAAHLALATVWALWTHTRVIGRLGWLEQVIITPSHHRVHHACNGPYLDQNYGAVLVFWDKLFGTFEPETLEPVYGTRYGTDELCAFRSNARPFLELVRRASTAPGWLGALETLLRPPSWDPVTRREQVPGFDAGPATATAPETGVPRLKLAALAVCAAIAVVPLYASDTPLLARAAIGAGVFAALSWLSAQRSVAGAPRLSPAPSGAAARGSGAA